MYFFMTTNKEKLFINILLVIFLFGIHSKFQWFLNPDKIRIDEVIIPFSYLAFEENSITAMIFALIFSVMAVYSINAFFGNKRIFFTLIILYASLESIGAFMYFSGSQFTELIFLNNQLFMERGIWEKYYIVGGGIYYGLYAFACIMTLGLKTYYYFIHNNSKQNNEELDRNTQIIQMNSQGISQSQIAKKFNITQSTVSKIINK